MQQHYNTMKSSYVKSKFVGIYFFIQPVVLVLDDLDFVKTILIKDFQFFHDRGLYHNVKDDPLTGHLFLIEGQKWTDLRKKLSPTFTSGKMKIMFPTIVAVGEQLRTTLQDSLSMSNEIEIKDMLARFTTDVIGTCAFGLECNSLKDPSAEFRRYGKKIFQNSSFFLKAIIASQFKAVSHKLGVTLLPKDVTSFFMGVVKDTIKSRETHNIQRNDFMNMLIDMKNSNDPANQFTVEEIAAQAFVFFVAGFETSSTTMSYALYELAQNQELQDNARECVRTVLKEHDNKFTYEAMMEMTYITQCNNESLRKYPPASSIFRKVTQDYKVPDSNVVLPKGLTVIIPVYAIHHDPEFYENPEKFDPERFTSENEEKRRPCSFLPFGDGPRNCIGLRFGLMQARIGLAVFLSNFKFETSDKTENPLTFSRKTPILQPVGGIWLKVEKI